MHLPRSATLHKWCTTRVLNLTNVYPFAPPCSFITNVYVHITCISLSFSCAMKLSLVNICFCSIVYLFTCSLYIRLWYGFLHCGEGVVALSQGFRHVHSVDYLVVCRLKIIST